MKIERFIKVKYFKGFTEAMLRSSTKLNKFVPEAQMKNTQTLIICKLAFLSEMHSFTVLQSKREGAANIPTPKSVTAKDTRNALVLVRSWRLL